MNDSVTSKLARYKELVGEYEKRAKFELTDRERKIDEQMRIIISDRNRKETSLKSELHSAQILLSSTVDHYKSKTEEVTFLKKDFKQKEDKFFEEFLDLKKLKDKIEDRLYKQDQSIQIVHMLCKQKSFYDEKHKVAIGYKNPVCLARAKQAQSALYNGHVLVTTNHTPTVIHDSEDTRELAEITRNRMLALHFQQHSIEKKNLEVGYWLHEVIRCPLVYLEVGYWLHEVDKNTVDKQCAEIEKKNLLIENLVANVNDRSREPYNAIDVTALIEQNDCDRVELEKVKQHYKELYDSIKITRAHTSEKTSTMLNEIESLKAQLRSKEPCFTSEYVKPKVLAPGMYAIDVKPIPHPLKNNRSAHLNYVKHLKESVETVREIVEEARVVKPLDNSLNYACQYTKLSQELLECVIGTCPKNFNEIDNKAPSTPVTRKKQVTFRVNDSTEASGSKPRSNTKKNRILPAKKENKKEVEVHLRTNNYEMCVVNILNSMNATPTVKIVLNKGKQIWKPKNKLSDNSLNKTKQVWKATGKLFANVGYQWRSTGKKVALGKLNCGYSKHMTGNRSKLKNFVEKFIGSVRFGNDHFGAIMGYGDYVIGDSVISRVYYVEGLGHNLFSVGQFCDSDLEVAFRKHSCFVRDINGADLLKGSRRTNLYTISIDDMMKSSPICLLSKASKSKSWLWHRRLNHLNFGTINDLARKDLVRGLPRLKFEKDHLCSACQLGKSKKFSHKPKSENTNMEVLHTLHMDLCGPMRVQSINGKKYILVIVDDYSRFTWVKFLRSKDETPEFVINFLKQIQVGLNKTVRYIRTDNGTEFVNQVMSKYYEGVGIFHQKSVPRTPQQNGVVERRNRTLVEAARTMLIFSKAPMFLWAEAVATACYTQNRSLIHTRHNKTPYELVHDKKPDLTFLRVFGALCYPTNDSEDLGKFQAKADIGIFVGYAPSRKGYRIYNKRTRRLMETIHVTFDEMHQTMAPVRISSGPEPIMMTPGQLNSGLAPSPVPATTYIPPTDKDLEILFQPMFDEYFDQSTDSEPVPTATVVNAPIVSTNTSVSTMIAQDAPSTSHSLSSSQVHPPVFPQGVAAGPIVRNPTKLITHQIILREDQISSSRSILAILSSCIYKKTLASDALSCTDRGPSEYSYANAATKNLIIYQMDVKTDFLNGASSRRKSLFSQIRWQNKCSTQPITRTDEKNCTSLHIKPMEGNSNLNATSALKAVMGKEFTQGIPDIFLTPKQATRQLKTQRRSKLLPHSYVDFSKGKSQFVRTGNTKKNPQKVQASQPCKKHVHPKYSHKPLHQVKQSKPAPPSDQKTSKHKLPQKDQKGSLLSKLVDEDDEHIKKGREVNVMIADYGSAISFSLDPVLSATGSGTLEELQSDPEKHMRSGGPDLMAMKKTDSGKFMCSCWTKHEHLMMDILAYSLTQWFMKTEAITDEHDQEKSKVREESDSTIPDPSHQTVTSTPLVIAPFTDVSSTKPSSLLTTLTINTEATTITTSLPEITPIHRLQLKVGKIGARDKLSEALQLGYKPGRSTKRRRSDSAASGSAQPPPKDDDQSSKKPRESDASASKQHPALTSTGWEVSDREIPGVDSSMQDLILNRTFEQSSDDIPMQMNGYDSDMGT
ncbi:retrovirus-related pol polyprotein from transposon TNT 1-94 [Tanacetum coccineum]